MGSILGSRLFVSCAFGLASLVLAQRCASCEAQIKVEIQRFGKTTDLAIVELNTAAHESLSFILATEADACSVFSDTTAGKEYLATLSAMPGGGRETGSIAKLPSPLRLGNRLLSDDLVKVINFPEGTEGFKSMDTIVGFIALRSIPYPFAIFDIRLGSVEFADSVQPFDVKRKFPLFSDPVGGYCVAVPIFGENRLFNLGSTGSTDVEFGFSLVLKIGEVEREGSKKTFRLIDTPMNAASDSGMGYQNTFRIYGMDSDKVVVDKSAMMLILTK